jgi:hypothetical protein
MTGKKLFKTGLLLSAALMLCAVSYSPLVQVVPGPGLPAPVKCLRSNNNLDIVNFDGKIFLAFRTAPTHFAGTKTHMYIVSSKDQKKWDFEAEVFMGSDMREPRFLVLGNKLMFYYFQAGKSIVAFSPQHIYAMERKGPGEWTKPVPVFEQGCVLWRSKLIDGKPYITTYCGEGEYTGGNSTLKIYLLTTSDGYKFTPVNPSRPVIATGGSETDFEIDSKGNLYGVIRNEGGDGKTWASHVCKAPAGDLTNWSCVETPYKPDSPLVFKHDDDIYVIGRRSLDGAFDKGDRWMADSVESLYYLARFWWTKKRTCLYKLDKDSLALVPVLDFPSKGDTSFAGLIKQDNDHYLMYNYSSDPNGKDRVWMSGQLHKTFIYSTVISFQ